MTAARRGQGGIDEMIAGKSVCDMKLDAIDSNREARGLSPTGRPANSPVIEIWTLR